MARSARSLCLQESVVAVLRHTVHPDDDPTSTEAIRQDRYELRDVSYTTDDVQKDDLYAGRGREAA